MDYNNWITVKSDIEGLQSQCFKRADTLNDTVFLARDVGTTGKKIYNSFKDHKQLVTYLDNEENKNHYELIKNECIEYYDFDYENNNREQLINFYKDKIDIIDCFLDDFVIQRNTFWNGMRNDKKITSTDYGIGKHDLIVMESCRDTKISLHVLVRRLGSDKPVIWFTKATEQKKIMNLFNSFLKTKFNVNHCIILDLSVYNSNSLFRCFGQTKIGKENYLKPYGKRTTDLFQKNKKLLFCSYVKNDFNSKPIFLKEEEKLKDYLIDVNYENTEDVKSILKLFNLIYDSVNKGENKYLCDEQVKNKINYDKWKNVVFALFHYLPESICIEIFPRVFELYRSSKSYNINVIIKSFLQTKGNYGITIKSIHSWASQHPDYAEQFPTIVEEINTNKTIKYVSGNHMQIAKMFLNLFGRKNIRITSQKDLSFYMWDNKKLLWISCDKESLIKIISDICKPYLDKLAIKIGQKMNSVPDTTEECMLNVVLKQVQKLISNIQLIPYLTHISKAIGSHNIDKDFESKIINKTTYELPINNGKLINFKTLEVRNRIRTDYYSFECPVSFNRDLNLDCVEKFFTDICSGDIELKNYHQLLWGYQLTGEIKDRSLHILFGSGRNGKTSVINIIRNILLNFCVSLSEDINIKKSSKGASPELMDLLFSRCGSLPESDKKEELNSKRIKSITGDDEINARHLFGHNVKFKTQCKLIWATNFKPKINVDDQAILDRIKLIPFNAQFESSFVNTDYIKDLQENKLNEFFTWFCIGANKWYNGVELIPCNSMKKAMNTYVSENDIVEEFMEENIETVSLEEYKKIDKLNKVNYRIKKLQVYAMFLEWCRCNNNEKIIKKDFYISMEKRCESIKIGGHYFICKIKNIFEENEVDI